MKENPIVLTGHRPTGPRHIGHLVGTLTNWVALQDSHACVFLVADLHVLTTDFAHPDQVRANTLEIVFDWLAAGIDPQLIASKAELAELGADGASTQTHWLKGSAWRRAVLGSAWPYSLDTCRSSVVTGVAP